MTANFDKKKYGSLLLHVLPSAIKSEEDLDRLSEEIDRLITKDIKQGGLSPEEDSLLDLLSVLVESYEDEHHSIPALSPHENLKYLMLERGVKQADLLTVFGSSGLASEVVNAKRSISKSQAKKLAEFFGVSAELFI